MANTVRNLIAAALALVPGAAMAQEAAQASGGMDGGQMAVMIVGVVIALAATAATSFGFWRWFRPKARAWGAAIDAETGVPIFGVIFDKGVVAMSLAADRIGPVLREVTADGKIDPAEWDRLKAEGIEVWKELLHPLELEGLSNSTGGKVDTYLEGLASHAIATSKRRGAGAKRPGGELVASEFLQAVPDPSDP